MMQPQYRKTLEARELLRTHPPRFEHPHKQLLFEMAYQQGTATSARIEVSRWPQVIPETIVFADSLEIEIRPDFYDYRPADGCGAVQWHVNFADPELFVAYGTALLAQDEMQVAEHPLLGSVREFLEATGAPTQTLSSSRATPILLRNVERRIAIATNPDTAAGRPHGIYGGLFAMASPEVIRQAVTPIDPPTSSNIIAMSAPPGGEGAYSPTDIELIFATAYTAFAAAKQESSIASPMSTVAQAADSPAECVVHTGFWGCGVFGGDRTVMVALQVLAARAADVDFLFLHAGNESGYALAKDAVAVANDVVRKCGATCRFAELVPNMVARGYSWGQGDGN